MRPTASGALLRIPELGPSLGRLVAPPPPPPGSAPPWIPLEDLRVALVSQIFDLAGDARRWVREGDRELALATLNREAWETAWNRTVQAVAERAVARINENLMAAAGEVRLPARRRRGLPLEPTEARALSARLTHGAGGFHQALQELDRAAHDARSERAPAAAVLAWQEALATAARRLEAAWLALEETLADEWRTWGAEVEDLRGWRRPLWPLALSGALLFGLAGYAGLVLGGYLPVPAALRPPVEWLWSQWS